MPQRVPPLIGATLLLWSLAVPNARALCVHPGDPAPDFTAASIDGGDVRLSTYRGKVVILAFWSSWCSRCREEIDFLKGLQAAHPEDLVVLAVNQESDAGDHSHVEEVRGKVAEWDIGFPVLLDPQLQVWGDYCLNALPTSVVVDRGGRVHFAEANFYWASEDNIRTALAELGVRGTP